MMDSTSYFVETEGIRLPDGTIFGAGIERKMLIVRGESYRDTFKVFDVVDGRIFPHSNKVMEYKEMKAFLRGMAEHYRKHDMKLWAANHSEWEKATYKKLVDENY